LALLERHVTWALSRFALLEGHVMNRSAGRQP
jgi:hypothetical protein